MLPIAVKLVRQAFLQILKLAPNNHDVSGAFVPMYHDHLYHHHHLVMEQRGTSEATVLVVSVSVDIATRYGLDGPGESNPGGGAR